MLKRFIAYYKPHKFMFTMDMLASLLISIIGMVYPIVTNKMLNDLIPNKLYKQIILAGIIVLVLYVIRMLLRYFVQYYGHMIGTRMQQQMRTDLFSHLEKLPYSFFDNHETGSIMTRLTSDLFEISELAHHGPENIFICAVMIIGSFAYLCTIDVYRLSSSQTAQAHAATGKDCGPAPEIAFSRCRCRTNKIPHRQMPCGNSVPRYQRGKHKWKRPQP